MTWLALALAIFGVLGLLFGLRCYAELRKWARMCQGTRIVIAHKGRVQLNAPVAEWLEWAEMLEDDDGGRVIYHNGKVRVAILKKTAPAPLVKPAAQQPSSSSTAAAA